MSKSFTPNHDTLTVSIRLFLSLQHIPNLRALSIMNSGISHAASFINKTASQKSPPMSHSQLKEHLKL